MTAPKKPARSRKATAKPTAKKKPVAKKPAATRRPKSIPAKPKSTARKAPAKGAKPDKRKAAPRERQSSGTLDLHALGGRVVSIFGTRGNHALIQLPTEVAEELFSDPLDASGLTDVITAAERDVAAIKKRDKALGESALARAAIALAIEISHPYNSATSKSMCARELRETTDRLRELAPEEEEADQLDDLSARRAARIAGA